jgi:flagellar hook-associated protein 3 FlgL
MRISTAQLHEQGLLSMLDRQTELARTQQQLSTGKRILSPSDDVLGTTQSLALQQVIDTHEQFGENAVAAENRLEREEIAITQVVDMLQRTRELAIQANSGSTGAQGRASIAVEIREQLDAIMGIANTVDANGDYLFAGNNVGTVPFTAVENPAGSGLYDFNYTGDQGQRSIQIGSTRQIPVGDPGDDVFVNVPITGGGSRSIFETLEQFALDLEANTPDPNTIGDLQLAMESLGSFRSAIGGRLNAIDSQKSLNSDIVYQGQKTLSEVQDLDFAEAISRMNRQLAGLEASQMSFARVQNLSLFSYL